MNLKFELLMCKEKDSIKWNRILWNLRDSNIK